MAAILPFVYVGLGSMLGGVSRYGMTLVTQNFAAMSMPVGTLVSNWIDRRDRRHVTGALHGNAVAAGDGILWRIHDHVVICLRVGAVCTG